MRLRKAVIGVLVPFAAVIAAPHAVTLRAEAGRFNASTLRPASTSVSLTGSMHLRAFAGTDSWPTAAYIGVQQGPNRNDSVQVVTIRNRQSDDYLVVGYRLVIGGKEVTVKAIENVAIEARVQVEMSFSKGVATIRVDNKPPIEVHTPFREVAPYVSVSSGEAEFAITP
jgi:hypothetical protein